MSNEPNTPTSVDLTDLVEVMCDYRREKFPFERSIAAMTFCVWLHYPRLPAVIEYGRFVAAANIIRSLRNDSATMSSKASRDIKEVFAALITPEVVSTTLFDRAVFEYLGEFEFDEIGTAEGVSNFLLRCPTDLKPSLNKAFFFCDEAGYPGKKSISTVKKAWAQFAAVTPFASARFFIQLETLTRGDNASSGVDPFRLPPDRPKSVDDAHRLMSCTKELREYFSACRFIQEKLIETIGRKGTPTFMTFPKSIQPKAITIHPLDPKQIEIVERYRAPKSI